MTKQDLASEKIKCIIIRLCGVNYHAEISKGIRLAKYVRIK